MRRLNVENFRLPTELDIALTCSKDNEIELTDDWIIIKKNSVKQDLPYYMEMGDCIGNVTLSN